LMENQVGQANHWLELRLVATAPRDATGARVTITTSVGKQVREVTSGNGHYNTQLSRHLMFGLGGDSGAGNVTIRWPNGEVQVLGDVKADRRLLVTQGGEITAY
ncbi:MAG: ASPIC/UnbV domain-containing protein, partial [Myxococcales bacterium]|nr:ASPIC/UnbV domain-containing protein [Myxococcales bacterium]